MSWKCEIVTDLAPLYHDGEASKVSRRFVKEHLRECQQCRGYYKKYQPLENVGEEMPFMQEEGNFLVLAKKMRKRRLLLWGGFLSYVSATIVALVAYYVHKNKEKLKNF